MPGNFAGGLRLGGAYVDVGLDLSQLDRDLGQLRGQLERWAAGARVNVPVGAGGRPGGGGGGAARQVAGPALGGVATIAPLVAAIAQAGQGAAQAALQAATPIVRAVDGVIDRLGTITKNTGVMAANVRAGERAAASIYRAERGEFHRAQSVRLHARALGERATIERPEDFFGRLPSDVRAGTGIGAYGRPRVLVPRAGAAGADPAGMVQAAIAPAQRAGDSLTRAGQRLQEAATSLERAAAATRATVLPHGVSPVPLALHPDVIEGALAEGQLPAGFEDPTRTDFVRGSRRQRAHYRRPRRTAPPPGAIAGAVAPGGAHGAQSGFLDLGVFPAAAKGVFEGARRLEAALASFGHAGVMAFGRVVEAAAGFRRGLGRIEQATRPLRAVVGGAFSLITFPIRLAGRALGLFDDRVGVTTNALRLMGRVSATAGGVLAAPFRAANLAATALSNTLKSMAFFALMDVASRIVPWIARSVTSAIGLNESMARVKATFGAAAGVATGFGETLVSKFGLARQEIAETQASFGTLLKGSGVAQQQAAQMANVLTKRAADISQRFGVGFEEASGAIAGALAGRTREVAQFGAVIRQADIQNRAMTLGFEGTGRSLGKTARAAAVYSLVLEGTAGAQGALEQRANTTSRLMAELSGRIENSAAAIGTKMEPAFQEVLLLVNEVYEGSKKVNEGIRSGVAAISDSVIDTIHVFRQMWQNWDATVELMGTLALQLGENLGAVFAHLGDVAGTFLGWFADNWRTIFTDAFELVKVGVANLVENFRNLGTAFAKWIRDPLHNPFQFQPTNLLEGFRPQTPELKLPELKLPNSYADKIAELIGKIMGTELGRQAAGAVAAEKPLTEEEAAAGKKEKTTAGQIVGARELSDLLQKSVFDKDSKNLEKTAKNSDASVKHLEAIRKGIEGLKLGAAVLG